MASDLRLATPRTKTAFLFTRVGLAGCDMGACAILPRLIGQGRASELLFTGRVMTADEGERWGFHNRVVAPEEQIGRAHVCTPVTNAHRVCRLLLEKTNTHPTPHTIHTHGYNTHH